MSTYFSILEERKNYCNTQNIEETVSVCSITERKKKHSVSKLYLVSRNGFKW